MGQHESNLRPKWRPTRRYISLAPASASMLVTGLALQAGGLLGVTEAMVECSEADLGELVAQQVAQDALPTLGWQ
jgi:hypothetical protein